MNGTGSLCPVVRHFIACGRIDVVGQQCSLVNLIHAIEPLPGAAYPHIHSFQVQLVLLEADETLVYTSPAFSRDLGGDPLAVHGQRITLRNLLFPRASLYEFRLFCDGVEIAREPILLRELP
jgi:hypothetical protein